MFAQLSQAEEKRRTKTAQELKKLCDNARVAMITVQVNQFACPACQEVRGTYEKNAVPELPWEACSCDQGCTARYIPVLAEVYP